MRLSLMRHGTVSVAKTEAPFQNKINKAVRSSSYCMICGGLTSAQYHLVRGSGLGPMSA
jgi:hypothetical protein